MIRACGRLNRTTGHARCDTYPTDLAADSTNERRIVGRVHRSKIGNLHGNDVIENSKSAMHSQSRMQLISEGNSWLVDKQWGGRKQIVDVSQYDVIQRFI